MQGELAAGWMQRMTMRSFPTILAIIVASVHLSRGGEDHKELLFSKFLNEMAGSHMATELVTIFIASLENISQKGEIT